MIICFPYQYGKFRGNSAKAYSCYNWSQVITDLDLRGGGYVDFAYNFFPWSTELPLSASDLQHMPGRVLFWMSSLHCDENMKRFLKPEYLNKDPPLVF